MSAVRSEAIHAAINKSLAMIDYNVHDDLHKQHKFRAHTLLADNSLTRDEKNEALKILYKTYDRDKVSSNSGTRRTCKNCKEKCLATLYCEYCVRNYLKINFSKWTSGNNDIDDLIQKCQLETLDPEKVVEWIPYNSLTNIKYLTKGGFSEIYKAIWIDGKYKEWSSKKQRLIRYGVGSVILKRLENVENASQRWFEEAKSHLTISKKWPRIVPCYGLTKDPLNGDYMLVMNTMDTNLRDYLRRNHNQLTWKEGIHIAIHIIRGLCNIHNENAIHRDLHSGNILFQQISQNWYISDLGFCGPADKSTKSIYGNLPYLAPEVIAGKQTTQASDIYSFAMLMWEISSGQPPFSNHENDYYLATNIINGMRPAIVPGTPSDYENLMKQCWNANPLERPEINALVYIMSIIYSNYQNKLSNELIQSRANNNSKINKTSKRHTSSRSFTSKIHQFGNFPEPKNATLSGIQKLSYDLL